MTLGIVYCLATSFLWAISSIFATNAVRAMGPQTYNCLRLILGSSLLWLIFLVSHSWKMPEPSEWFLIVISAAIGLAFGDMFLFKGFEILGARRSTLIFMLNIPITTLIGFVLLSERLSQQEMIGGAVSVTGIALATYAGKNDKKGRTKVDLIEGKISKGILFCFVAACCQSVGLLTLKPVLSHNVFSPVQIAALRFTVAGFVSLLLAYKTGGLKNLRFKAEIDAVYSALLETKGRVSGMRYDGNFFWRATFGVAVFLFFTSCQTSSQKTLGSKATNHESNCNYDQPCFVGRTLASSLSLVEPSFKFRFEAPPGWITDTQTFRSQGVAVAWFPIELGKIDDRCVIYFRHSDGPTIDNVVDSAVAQLSISTSSILRAQELQSSEARDGRAIRFFRFDGYRDGRREVAAYSQGKREVIFFVLACESKAWRQGVEDALRYVAESSTYEPNPDQ